MKPNVLFIIDSFEQGGTVGKRRDLEAILDQLLRQHSAKLRIVVDGHDLHRSVHASPSDKARVLMEAARVTTDVLRDPSGAVALWQQALALAATEDARLHAAQAAWSAGDVELTLQWSLGPRGELPRDQPGQHGKPGRAARQ